jgi:hypothetical protein
MNLFIYNYFSNNRPIISELDVSRKRPALVLAQAALMSDALAVAWVMYRTVVIARLGVASARVEDLLAKVLRRDLVRACCRRHVDPCKN